MIDEYKPASKKIIFDTTSANTKKYVDIFDITTEEFS